MTDMKLHPIFVSKSEAMNLIGIKLTKLNQLLKDGHLTKVKIGSRALVLFSSVIEFALSSLEKGNGKGKIAGILDEDCDWDSCQIAEVMVQRLYNTPGSLGPFVISDSNSPFNSDLKLLSHGSDPNENTGEIV